MGFGIMDNPRSVSVPSVLGSIEKAVGGRWPNGVVKVHLSADLAGNFRETAKITMERWQQCVFEYWGQPLIRFVQMAQPGNGIVTLNAKSSQADIGYRDEPRKCGVDMGKEGSLGSLPHEIGHTLGLAHEHERPDTPRNVAETLDAIQRDFLLPGSKEMYVTHGTAFDGKSIMMYAAQAAALGAGAVNGRTGGCVISPEKAKSGDWNPSLGDLDMIGLIYAPQLAEGHTMSG